MHSSMQQSSHLFCVGSNVGYSRRLPFQVIYGYFPSFERIMAHNLLKGEEDRITLGQPPLSVLLERPNGVI